MIYVVLAGVSVIAGAGLGMWLMSAAEPSPLAVMLLAVILLVFGGAMGCFLIQSLEEHTR